MTRKRKHQGRDELLEHCLAALAHAGTLDLSLDALAEAVGSSKRMLIHYFGGRDAIEEMTMSLLEDRLRARFRAGAFPTGTPLPYVVETLWNQLTSPESRGVLLLVMDLTRRSWNGSVPAKRFFEEQQRAWTELLLEFLPDAAAVEALLQLFQGAILVYLATGDRERGRRALNRFISSDGKLQRTKK